MFAGTNSHRLLLKSIAFREDRLVSALQLLDKQTHNDDILYLNAISVISGCRSVNKYFKCHSSYVLILLH